MRIPTSHLTALVLLAPLVPAHLSPRFFRFGYLGCYSGEESVRGYYVYGSAETTSLDDCVDVCNSMGYGYAGLTDGNQCYCGDVEPVASDLVPNEECDTPCSYEHKDPIDKCGGDNKWSFYIANPKLLPHRTTPAFTPTPTPTATASTGTSHESTIGDSTSTDVSSTATATASGTIQSGSAGSPSSPSSSIGSSSSAGVSPIPFTSNANRRYQLWW